MAAERFTHSKDKRVNAEDFLALRRTPELGSTLLLQRFWLIDLCPVKGVYRLDPQLLAQEVEVWRDQLLHSPIRLTLSGSC